MIESDSIDAVRADLAAAGRDPDQVQWAEAVTSWDEGKILCYRDGEAVVVKHVGRDESSDLSERYDSEAAAAEYLRRALVDREGRVIGDAEREEIDIRMRRRAEETKARLMTEQESP